MSRYREIQPDISPSNVIDTPRRLSNTSTARTRASSHQPDEDEPTHAQVSSSSSQMPAVTLSSPSQGIENEDTMVSRRPRRSAPRMHMPAMPSSKLARLAQRPAEPSPVEMSMPPAALPAPSTPIALELQDDDSEFSNEYSDSSDEEQDEYVGQETPEAVSSQLHSALYHYADSSANEIPFSFQMGSQLERMQILLLSAQRLWYLGVHSLDKLFILKEEELLDLCDFRMIDVLSFRLAKSLYEQSRNQGLPSGLVSAMPIFRGDEKQSRAIADPVTFLQRFEAVLATSNVHETRWANLLTINLAKPEDSAFWRNHLEVCPTTEWATHRRLFLEHFECYDQRSKYIEAVYSLRQKADEPVQRYFDGAAEIIRKAQLSVDDPLVVGCLRKGIHSSKLQEFITLREEPRRPFTYHQLMSLALLGEDRLKTMNRAFSTSPKDKKRCYICNKRSHRAFNCPSRQKRPQNDDGKNKESAKKPRITCPRCPKETHAAKDCPKQVCRSCQVNGHSHYNCPKAVCNACGAKGHIATSFTCPKRPNKVNKGYSDRAIECDVAVEYEMRKAISMKKENAFIENLEQVLICAFEKRKSQIAEDSTISIPVMLESYPCMGMIDTGASHSILDVSILPHLLLELSELECLSQSGHSAFAEMQPVNLYRTPTLKLRVGNYEVERSFYVAEIFTTFIIGRDLLSTIGITLSGLPTSFPGVKDDEQSDKDVTASSSSLTSIGDDETHEVFTTLHRIDDAELETLTSALEKSLTSNEKIPESDFCNHKEAIVSVEMDDRTPIYRPQFEIPAKLQPIIDEQISKWMSLGKVEIASPANRWNSSLLIVPKQDLYGNKSDWRVCFDARAINTRLKADTYGIPRIKELFKRINGFEYCSSLDLVAAYQQMLVREEDRDVLTFSWKGIKYRFKGAPFGLTHLPGQFQRLMNCVLVEHYQYVLIYLDDVFIFSKTLQEHIEHCNRVIQTLTEYNLRLRRGKCHFGYKEAVLLGHVISGGGIRADPRKIATFAAMKSPVTGKQLQALLGFASYLRDYIPRYSAIAAPLEAIKNVKKLATVWTAQHEEAFELLKKVLSSSTVLSTPDYDHPFMVATDSSQFGNGAVLYQEINGKIRYVQFFAKALNKSQINYPATKRELLAIVQALRCFHYYLFGRHFDLYTDHKALTFLFTTKDPSYMLLNWMEELMTYNFTIHHRPGIEMVLPDALSRLFHNHQSHKRGDESASDNADCVRVAAIAMEKTSVCTICKKRTAKACNTGLCKAHCTGCRIHPQVVQGQAVTLPEPVEIDDISPTRVKSWMKEFISNVIHKKEPENDEAAMTLIRKEHDISHAGTEQMFTSLFRKGWYWSEMKKQCSLISNSCVSCLQFNIARQGYHPLTTISAALPFDHIAIDLGQVSQTSKEGNNFILVVTDICTRFTLLRAIPNKSALTVSRQLYQIITEFGLPRIIQSDNGTEFVNSVINQMKNHCGFTQRTISSYHPQANGTAESHVKIAKQLLNKYTKGDWSEWCVFIPAIQLAMNTRITQRHSSTPFSLMFTRQLNDMTDYSGIASKLLTEEQMIERNTKLTRILYPAVSQAVDGYNTKMMDDFKLSHKILQEGYPKGALVMKRVDVRNAKTEPRYEGPFKVLEKTRNNAYVLLDAAGALYQKRVPADQLKLISVPDIYLNMEDEHYEVEDILKHRGPPSQREYFVKWKNYPSSDNSWVKADDFDAPHIVQEYWKQKNPHELNERRRKT
jgi:hypothetical protein